MDKKEFNEVAALVKETVGGRLEFVKKYSYYIIVVPQGYDYKETIYNDRVYFSLSAVKQAISKKVSV